MTFPFRGPATGDAFFAGPQAHAAELKLAYVLEQSLDVALLVAPPGLGKTTLLRRAVARASAAGFAVADVFYPTLDSEEFLDFIEAELAIDTGSPESDEPRFRRIAAHARALRDEGRGILIAIDDAHLLRGARIFETLHTLLNLRDREEVCMTILLAGQPSLLTELAKSPSFSLRVAVTATLSPLTREETAGYVRHRLTAADHDPDLFSDVAIDAVWKCSCGIPRVIDRICEMATLIVTADNRREVTEADVGAVARESAAIDREAA